MATTENYDPTPWFVGGGAHHSPEVARLLAFAATSGAEGVVGVGDLKVAPLSVPGTAVRVLTGAALIRNRATGGSSQTYVARLPLADQIDIAPTTSSSKRSDLIVARVEDPFMLGEPWQTPADPTTGRYIYTRVIPNVPAGTTRLQDVAGYSGNSAITLARVDLPASTGTVTADMITDLRKVALPRRETMMFTINPVDNRRLQGTTYMSWPVAGQDSTGLFDTIDIPEWATVVQVLATYTQVRTKGDTYGYIRLLMGNGNEIAANGSFNTTNSDASEVLNTFQAAVRATVPAALRGTTQPMRLQGRLAAADIPAAVGPWSTPDTRVVIQVEFAERAA